ncbi:Cyclodeaminase/cyclohydrolase domain protein [Candidatus Omnitrophus magneticus]|uniref:Cyclodeaminase/cyclohydrolase domain protein n=1 Tax=Candidatus Omnitrophus magneticus TaxID=1609969 RepID=A0A0F0CNY6_9BACT|nr:Cyclodeaminase/cyclohydrolase domain protein [Candidatus Omnitrophus magneticus]
MSGFKYIDSTIREYLNNLGAKKNVPGGGSAGAVVAAVGANLILMSVRYSIKKTVPISVNKILTAAEKKIVKSVEDLTIFIDADCYAFSELMAAMIAAKERGESVSKKYYFKSLEVPLKVAGECAVLLEITSFIAKYINRNLFSDILCSSRFLYSAFFSAKINVMENLKYIDDEIFMSECSSVLFAMGAQIEVLCKDIEKNFSRNLVS